MRISSVNVVIRAGATLLLFVGAAEAQRLRNPTAQQVAASEAKCRSSVAQALSSQNSQVKQLQLNLAGECPDTGAAIIAAMWRTPPTDKDALYVLVGSSRRMIDGRIADAALAGLRDRGQTLELRVKALEAVAGQLGAWVSFGQLGRTGTVSPATGETTWTEVVQTGRVYSYEWMRGRVPVTNADRTRLRQALLELERGPDDKYLLLAIKGLFGEIGRS